MRERIIPSGHCVATESEVFAELDRGVAAVERLDVGRAACTDCIQLPVCQENRAVIGAQLYELTGSRDVIIGGEAVAVTDQLQPRMRPRVLEPVVPFDLTELPSDPRLSLNFIRGAVRTKVFVPLAHTPPAVAGMAREFVQELRTVSPALYEQLQTPSHMTSDAVTRGLEHVTATLFLQADYSNVAARKKNKARYRPGRVDSELHYAITEVFVEDMLRLDAQGFKAPERQALVHSPEEYAALAEAYLRNDDISPSEFHDILQRTINDPEKALQERAARLHLLRELQPDVPESALRARARRSKLPAADELVQPRRGDNRRLTAGAVREICSNKDPLAVTAQYGTQAVDAVRAMHRQFAEHPVLGKPSVIARFAHKPPSEALSACENIHNAYGLALQERAKRGGENALVPKKFMEGYVTKHGFERPESYDEMAAAYVADRMTTRLRQRARLQDAGAGIPRWAIDRVVSLYGIDAAEDAAEALYTYCKKIPVLGYGLSEMPLLQDASYRDEVDKVRDPFTGKYVAFHPALNQLQPDQRLAFAYCSGLSRQLYGVDISREQVATVSGRDDLETYFDEQLLPLCQQLVRQPLLEGALPVPMRQLSEDLITLEVTEMSEHALENARYLATVLGAAALELGPKAIELRADSDAKTAWLQQAVFTRCRPDHLAAAADVQKALDAGVIKVESGSNGYYVAMASYLRQPDANGVVFDEQQLAAAAHELKIDQVLFGFKVEETLKTRLEIGIEETAQPVMERIRQQGPKTAEAGRDVVSLEERQEPRSAPLMRQVEAGIHAQRLLNMLLSLPDEEQRTFNLRGAENPAQLQRELATLIKEGNEASEVLFAAADVHAKGIASAWHNKRPDGQLLYDDLLQFARLGIAKALVKYDYTKGAEFTTFAFTAARNAVVEGVSNAAATVRLPKNAITAIKKIAAVRADLEQAGQPLDPEVIATKAGISPARYSEIEQAAYVQNVEDENILAIMAEHKSPDGAANESLDSELLGEELNGLIAKTVLGENPTPTAKRRLTMFLMFLGGTPQIEIAQQFGIPVGTVKTSIHRVRETLKESRTLQDYLKASE